MKTHDADLCERIRELEERVRELEARPPTWTVPVYPLYPWWGVIPNTTDPYPSYPWTITYGSNTLTTAKGVTTTGSAYTIGDIT